MNHTPGEWIVSKLKYPCEVDIVYVETDNELVICAVDGFVIGPEEALANARLIAASPVLLEENEANLVILKVNYGAIESLPIDALGEVWPTHEHDGYPIRDEVLHEIAARIKATEAAIRLATEETK